MSNRDREPWELTFEEIAGESPRVDPLAAGWNEEAFLLSSPRPEPVSQPFHAGPLKKFWTPDGARPIRYQYAAAEDRSFRRVLLVSRDVGPDGEPLTEWAPVGEYDGENLGILQAHRGNGAGSAFMAHLIENGRYRGPSIGYSPGGLATIRRAHRAVVLKAVLERKPVPEAVLASHPDLPLAPQDMESIYFHGTVRGNGPAIMQFGFAETQFGARNRGPGAEAEYRGVYLTKDRSKAEEYYSTISESPTNEVLGGGDILVVRVPDDRLCPPHLWRGFLTEAKIATLDENGDDAPRQVILDEQIRLARAAGYIGTTTRGGTETIIFEPRAVEMITWYESGSVPRYQDGRELGQKPSRARRRAG